MAQIVEIGNFTVYRSKRIGNGAFGTVYKATNKSGQDIAAKAIDLHRVGELAIKEARNFYKLKPIKHKNIIEIYDVFLSSNHAWIFMEHCARGDLEQYFQTSKSVESDLTKAQLMLQITKGIEFLHSNSIIHRDIKPANILATYEDHDGGKSKFIRLKLTDFGLTKFLDPDGKSTQMSSLLGTRDFLAPEFWKRNSRDSVSYDSSVDIFAGGLTFLAMLQAHKGSPLVPIIENKKDRGEVRSQLQTIGQAMNIRDKLKKNDLRLVEVTDKDSNTTKGVKKLIKQMTAVKLEYRITAAQVRAQLEAITNKDHKHTVRHVRQILLLISVFSEHILDWLITALYCNNLGYVLA